MRRRDDVEGLDLVPEQEPLALSLGRYGANNLAVMLAQVVAWAALLTAIDAGGLAWPLRLAALLAFCLLMQGVFTMLHEFCHGNAHAEPRLNALIGWVTATLFGTAPTLLRVQHWGHHRRNRSLAERAEFVHAGERRWSKTLQYYLAILGGIWLGCLLVPLLAPLVPHRLLQRLSRHERFNSFAAGFGEFSLRQWRALQLEGVVLLGFWGGILALAPWRSSTLALAYAGFAFSWSSLQWIYHMHASLHVIEGAFNLRAPLPVRALFLNFNYNLSHHRDPSRPWQELHQVSDPGETQALWYRYLLVFRPPVRFPEDAAR